MLELYKIKDPDAPILKSETKAKTGSHVWWIKVECDIDNVMHVYIYNHS